MPHLGLASAQTPAGRVTEGKMALSYDMCTMGPTFPPALEAVTYQRSGGVGWDWPLSIAVRMYSAEPLKWTASQSTLSHCQEGRENIEEGQRAVESGLLSSQAVELCSCSPEASPWNTWVRILWLHFSGEANVLSSALGLHLRKGSRPTESFLGE